MNFDGWLAALWEDGVPEKYRTPEAAKELLADLAQGRSFGWLPALSWYLLVVRGGVDPETARKCVRTSVPRLDKRSAARVCWIVLDGQYIGLRAAGRERWWDRRTGAEIPQADVFRRPPVMQLILDPAALRQSLSTASLA